MANMDPDTRVGAIALLFAQQPEGDDAVYAKAVLTLSGDADALSDSERSALPAEAADAWDDFISESAREDLLDELEDDPRVSFLRDLESQLPEEEDDEEEEEEDQEAVDSVQSPNPDPPLQAVVPLKSVAPPPPTRGPSPAAEQAPLSLTLSSPLGAETGPLPPVQRSAAPAAESPPQSVRRPPSTAIPSDILELVALPLYVDNATMHLEAALDCAGDLLSKPHLRSHISAIGHRGVMDHLTRMYAAVRRREHISDLETFQKVFGVTLPTT